METITESPPERVPARRRHVRHPAVAAAAVSALLASAATYTAVTVTSTAAPRAHSTSARPAAASLRDRTATWAAGPGYQAMLAVQADARQIGSDAGAYDLEATVSDGSQLAADAADAATMPPPAATGEYIAAMVQFAMAGQALTSGDLSGANEDMDAGTAHLHQVNDIPLGS